MYLNTAFKVFQLFEPALLVESSLHYDQLWNATAWDKKKEEKKIIKGFVCYLTHYPVHKKIITVLLSDMLTLQAGSEYPAGEKWGK